MLGLKTGTIRRRLVCGDLVARLYRWGDLPVLQKALSVEILQRAGAPSPARFASPVRVWRWIRTTFDLLYVIETIRPGPSRLVGFIGLHQIGLGEGCQLSGGIFDPEDRRRGYMHCALQVLLQSMADGHLFPTVYAEVLPTNGPSLHLLRTLNFHLAHRSAGRLRLKRALGEQGRDLPKGPGEQDGSAQQSLALEWRPDVGGIRPAAG